MPPDPLPQFSFLPWTRRGIAAMVDQIDHLGTAPASGPTGRATLTAHLTVDSRPVPGVATTGPSVIDQVVSLVGPGDIAAFRADAVLRAVPAAGSVSATPGELVYVEFYDEDFPWRYTPAKATSDHKLRPWIVLLVLAEGEYTVSPGQGATAILQVVDSAPLPVVTETWAWAHVQVSGTLGNAAGLDAAVQAGPDHAVARLLSPRRLRTGAGYRAFLVPAFEAGRLAGLGTPGTVPAQQPSWGSGQERRFPVLYDWAFRTGPLADFEVLARRPKPFVVGQSFGTRTLDVSDPGAGIEVAGGSTVALEGALRPVDFTRVDFPTSPGSGLRDQLQHLVDLAADFRTDAGTDDPIVTPPAYGRRAAGLERVGDVAVVPDARWMAELNLDPRNRVAAGLGAEIVRQRDEELMERAWAQVDELNAVNQRLREADLAIATSDRVFAKHLAGGSPDRLLRLTAAAHSTLAAPGTTALTDQAPCSVRGQVDDSRVPAAAQAPAFRRIARPQQKLSHVLTERVTGGLQTGLLTRLNADPGTSQAVSTAPPAAEPVLGVSDAAIAAAVGAAAQQHDTEPPKPRDVFLAIAREDVLRRSDPGPLTPIPEAAIGPVRTSLSQLLDRELPPPGDAQTGPLRAGASALIAAVRSLAPQPAGQAVLFVAPDVYTAQFGKATDGKTYAGVTVAPVGSTFAATATTTDPDAVAAFVSAMGAFTQVAQSRPVPPPADPLAPTTLAGQVAAQLEPRTALPARLATLLGGVDDPTAQLAQTRRLKPVLAYPHFDDPLFEPLRLLSQDYIVPNIADLGPETIAVMQPNTRFIEALLAGASTELGRELLWNEYPTDQRGTYFARFFDPADAGAVRPPDISQLHTWAGDLGDQSAAVAGLLVLVVRAELLVKFPDTVVFAQQARFVGTGAARTRTLDDTGTVHYPVLRGHLDPDISLYGFPLSPDQARGSATDAGYFFCFLERPGQLRFGLDLDADDDPSVPNPVQPPPLTGWDALNWKHLSPANAEQVGIDANAALVPTGPGQPTWGLTSAHVASILCQNPVWLARHASDMLPPIGPTP